MPAPAKTRARAPARILLSARGERSRIVVGRGLLDATGPLLARETRPGRAVLVAPRSAAILFAARAAVSLAAAGFQVSAVTVPDGEPAKSLAWASRLYRAFLRHGIDRGCVVVGLGGGAALDLAGFAAATFHRGIPTCLIPTTLLAQVDAAVGGKTAVNLGAGKNLVGSLHFPRLVLADVDALGSLPAREVRSGIAEIVKIGAACDRPLFELLERTAPALARRDAAALERVIAPAIRTKCRVVAGDPSDVTGRRAALNYGHTVGHALEAVLGYRGLAHGEAVAIGVVAAARLAAALGLAAPQVAMRQERLLHRLGLPTRIPRGVRTEDVVRALRRDKKARAGTTPFVLTPRIGFAKLTSYVPHDVLCTVLQGLGGVGRGSR